MFKHIINVERLYYAYDAPASKKKGEIKSELYLGAFPVVFENNPARNYFQQLKEDNIKAVLNIIDSFELDPKFSMSNFTQQYLGHRYWPITAKTWKVITTSDFMPVSVDDIIASVKFIRDMLSQGKNVYVHCKCCCLSYEI